MKNVFFVLAAAVAGILPLPGAEYIWTGLGRAGDWNDPDNWNKRSGTPGSGDVVYMNRTVKVDGATHNVELPIVITSPVVLGEGGLTLKIGTSVTNYISGAISGPGQLRITGNNLAIGGLTAIQNGNNAWTSALVLSGANTYEGGTSVYNVFLRGDSVSAFGADGTSVEFGGDASVSLNAPGKWRGYTYRIGSPKSASRPLSLQFGESLEWNGSLVRDDEGTGNKLYLLARQGVTVDAYANVDAPELNLYPAFHSTARVDFRNAVHVKAFCSDGGSVGTCGGLSGLCAPGGTYESTEIGFVFNVCCMDDYVFDESKALKFWSRYGNNQTGWCDLNGHDQRVKGLVSSWDADADYSEKGNYLGSRGGGAATLYLVGAQEDCLFRGLVTNEVSVVWAPQGDCVQTFSNRVHETTGRLVVSNGTMRIAGTATFAKVPEIVVAPGASFECLTTASGALSSLRRLVIGDGAVFTVGGTTPKPFADGRLELVVRGSGRLVLPAGMNVTAKTTSVDGVLPAAGVYGAEQSWLDGGTVDVGNVDVTCWRSAVSGRWHDAANWSAGVPTASRVAVISADGADYTVVVDADADLGRELRVSNAGEGAAKLSIAADAVMTNGFIAVGDGGTVEIASTGSLSYEGKGGGVRTASESEDVVVIGGGRFVVDGGRAEFLHMCGRMCVRGGETESGRVEVREGAFRHLQDRWGDYLRVEEGGEIEVSGGEMTFDSPATVATVGFRLFGGSLSVTGGVFGVGDETDNADMRLHDGIAVFGGDGVLQLDDKYDLTKLRLENFDVDDDLKVRFEGRSRIAPADFKIFHGGGTSAGVVEVDWCSSEFSGESAHVFRAMVGNQSGGSVTLNVSDSVFRAGSDGVFVAFNRAASWPSAVQKGFLNVGNNGRLIVEGFGAAVSGYSIWQLMGLNVGYSGLAGSNGSERPCRYPFEGEMTVSSGGSAEVLYGDVGIGVGYATGRLTVDGGALSVNDHDGNSTSYDYENRTFAIGLFGGVGECVVKNGATLSCRTDLFVGGAETNRYPYQSSGIVSTSRLPMDHSATGTLTVADADVALDGSLVLGQDGFAVLRRVGSEGAFTAGDLVCTNVADAAHTGSRIEFAADAEGFGTIDVDGSVTIGENAKLSVDLSAYTGGRRNFRLLGCASRQGDFAEMTVAGVRGDLAPVRFEWTARGLYLKMRRDLTVILR